MTLNFSNCKNAILMPRLDVSFKNANVPEKRGKIQFPVRYYWRDFCENLSNKTAGEIIEIPLGQITVDLVKRLSYDYEYIFVPHKQKNYFDCGNLNVIYYMQMAFPWVFQTDKTGWCAGSSVYPIKPIPHRIYVNYVKAKKISDEGLSKFPQPELQFNTNKNFNYNIFFPCQIPNDQTLQYHSNFTVDYALNETIKFCEQNHIGLIVKSHPMAKPEKMKQLKEICHKSKNAIWVDKCNVISVIKECDAVVTVNSGVGLETLLHDKPVFTFGNADYDSVAHKQLNEENWNNRTKYLKYYKDFIETYFDHMTVLQYKREYHVS